MRTDRMGSDLCDLDWDGNGFTRVGQGRAAAITLVPDPHYPDLWRIQLPDGSTTDLLNKTLDIGVPAHDRAAASATPFGIQSQSGSRQSEV